MNSFSTKDWIEFLRGLKHVENSQSSSLLADAATYPEHSKSTAECQKLNVTSKAESLTLEARSDLLDLILASQPSKKILKLIDSFIEDYDSSRTIADSFNSFRKPPKKSETKVDSSKSELPKSVVDKSYALDKPPKKSEPNVDSMPKHVVDESDALDKPLKKSEPNVDSIKAEQPKPVVDESDALDLSLAVVQPPKEMICSQSEPQDKSKLSILVDSYDSSNQKTPNKPKIEVETKLDSLQSKDRNDFVDESDVLEFPPADPNQPKNIEYDQRHPLDGAYKSNSSHSKRNLRKTKRADKNSKARAFLQANHLSKKKWFVEVHLH